MKKALQKHKDSYPEMGLETAVKLLYQSELEGSSVTDNSLENLRRILYGQKQKEIDVVNYFLTYYPVFLEIDRTLSSHGERQLTVAVDGMCGSGKTTLGQCLKEIYSCNIFHMDDFFLRPEQRTEERLGEAGGNVDYERFKEEILDHLSDKEGLSYRVYDCRKQSLGDPVYAPHARMNIIEGVYSGHPYFKEVYDLIFFLDIGEEEQLKRIKKRNGSVMLEQFKNQWIPMENRYFDEYRIREKSIYIKVEP